MLYVLNSAVITNPGLYLYQLLTPDEVKQLLQNKFISFVGHESTAIALSQLAGVQIPVNRGMCALLKGDRAVVCRIKTRLPEGCVLSQLSPEDFELGLLTRLE